MQNNIGILFHSKNTSLTQASKGLGMARGTVSKIVNYEVFPDFITVKTLSKIADYLEVPMSKLYEDHEYSDIFLENHNLKRKLEKVRNIVGVD